MSKTALRKELEQMTAAQLRDIILDAYGARPEIKEYFEFFLNPDADKLIERQTALAARELTRIKWGRSRARATVLKKLVRNVVSLNPGPEAEMRMMMEVLAAIGATSGYVDLSAPLENYAVALARGILDTGERAMLADKAHAMLDAFLTDSTYRLAFRRHIAENIGKK
ncbi:MAG: DUF6155 family protein [Bacteroides sp.]|nr:DUF6155 family protein [Bacteroides sp.]MCM1095673.1 DUF6155 family protein [Terasakiella sp.]